MREATSGYKNGINSNGRKKAVPAIMIGLLFALAALMMTGCETEQKTLEDYLADSPSAQQEIEDSLSGLNNSDMDVAVTYDQNRVIITCDMKTTYKKKVLKAMKKSYRKYMEKHLTEPMEKAVSNIEQETGVSGVTIQVIINNGNGKEIWSEVYPLGTEDETTVEEESSGTDQGSDTDKTSETDDTSGTE